MEAGEEKQAGEKELKSPSPPSRRPRRAKFSCITFNAACILVSMSKPCELCEALQAEIGSARLEARALHEDRAARVGDAPAGSVERAALFQTAMVRWQIAASNLEYHRADHPC
jgi:hypothetical protein